MTPTDKCICSEINARNCPVHQGEIDPITQPFSYLQAEIAKLQDDYAKLKEAYGVVREALEKIKKRGAGYNLSLSDVNFRLDCDCKDATEALAEAEEGLK